MTTTKHELIERVRLIVREMQADNAVNVARTAAVLNMMKQIENDEATVVLPQPCNGPLYDDWCFADYTSKMREEVAEIEDAFRHIDYRDGATIDHLFLECTDLITVVTSAMESAGCGEKQRQVYQGMVNHSNAVRDGGRRVRK